MKKIKLKYKDVYLTNIEPGMTLYEISKLVSKDYSFPIIGAKLNNLEKDLSTKINENGTIEFFDRSSDLGNRIYERSLEFLCIVAAKELLDEKTDVLMNYSLDNGIYCEVIGQRINKNFITKLEEKMHELVKQKLKFTKSKVSRLEAIKYFKQIGQNDKVHNLSYISNSTIDLYILNDVYDYFFGTLAYDTSSINLFELSYLSQNRFIITYPSAHKPKTVGKHIYHEKLFNKYTEYQSWCRLINIDMIADLNKIGGLGGYGDAIRLFETYYENQLSVIAHKIYMNRENVKVVLLSGPSSSGKTTTTKKLALYLRAKGLNPYQISLDDYFKNLSQTQKDENGDYDLDSIQHMEVPLFNNHLHKLLNGEKVKLPTYNFASGKKVYNGNTLQLGKNDILLIEGIHALNDKIAKEIKRENKFKIFITPIVQLKLDNHNRIRTTDVRKLRRIIRDNRYRKVSAEDTLKWWPKIDKGARENIYPFQDDVDAIINSSLSYEIGVLKIYAEPLLYGIKPTSPVYAEAIRLINLLRQCLPISSEDVPKDSILREFIGRGTFND